MASTQIVDIDPASDGTGQGPTVPNMVRNDNYFLEKLAERWLKDQRAFVPGVTYKLARLPAGYAGYEKSRDNDSKHVDRYLYGHPNGVMRSLNEVYPHFKYLQDNGGSVGCSCKHCTGTVSRSHSKKKGDKDSTSGGTSSIASRSPHFNNDRRPSSSSQPVKFTKPQLPVRDDNPQGLPQGRLTSDSDSTRPRIIAGNKALDEEGTPDIYRKLIDRTKEAGSDGITEDIIDQLSPDWRVGNDVLQSLLRETQKSPTYVPRLGELVFFARNVSDEGVAWDATSQALWRIQNESNEWIDRIKWEAGIVTQTPVDKIDEGDLAGLHEKKQNVTYSGFRIEPMPDPSSDDKQSSKQHKYVPLHAIRPFAFWKECVGSDEQSWHPTIKHALTAASSFCLIGKYSFKGIWPEATLFCRGLFLGSELIIVGDAVRLAPRDQKRSVSDVMIVSSIRLRFVNLDQASDDDYDNGRPYTTCLHVCGKTFSLDPKRSADGIGKNPVKAEDGLPERFRAYGQWFNTTSDRNAKLEVPYNRILGRCYEDTAIKAWFATPSDIPPRASFQAVNSQPKPIRPFDLSRGYEGIKEARKFSREHDKRIETAANQAWFWADTRIEQLDLHEVNGAFVGVKDGKRSKKDINTWRQALKVLDGKKDASEDYWAARKQRLQEEQTRQAQASSSWGQMGSAVKIDHQSTDAENGLNGDSPEDGDAMDYETTTVDASQGGQASRGMIFDLTQESDDDEMYE